VRCLSQRSTCPGSGACRGIVARRGQAIVYIPIVTMVLVSLVLTLLINIILRLLR